MTYLSHPLVLGPVIPLLSKQLSLLPLCPQYLMLLTILLPWKVPPLVSMISFPSPHSLTSRSSMTCLPPAPPHSLSRPLLPSSFPLFPLFPWVGLPLLWRISKSITSALTSWSVSTLSIVHDHQNILQYSPANTAEQGKGAIFNHLCLPPDPAHVPAISSGFSLRPSSHCLLSPLPSTSPSHQAL